MSQSCAISNVNRMENFSYSRSTFNVLSAFRYNQNRAAELQVAIESDEVKRWLFALLDKMGDKAVAEEAAV